MAKGERILVGVSGGADSMCLALALSELRGAKGWGVTVACVDHGLRPESAVEAGRVGSWAESNGLPFVSARVVVGREGGLEGAARKARYGVLERLVDETESRWIATAHTATDQAETVLLRLGRGAGLRGARGIHEERGRVLRPLLQVTRPEVEDFLASRGVTPLVNDPSNLDLDRARNRVRHRVLPELRLALGEGVDRALVRFARHAHEDEEALSQLVLVGNPAPRAELAALARATQRRWVRRWCEELGYRPNSAELEAATRLLAGGRRPAQLEIARRLRLTVGREHVELTSSLHASSPTPSAGKGAVGGGTGYFPKDGEG